MPSLQPRRRRIGQLDTLFVEGLPEAPTVILFHGYGADMSDLAPLAGALQAPKGTNWIFPNGHISLSLGPHMEGRAWFPISLADLEKAQMGTPIDLTQVVPPGLKKSREHALALIESLDVPMNRLVLGGFSQGAMLATDVALRLPERPAGLAILSGSLVNSDEWRALAAKYPGFEFFQSHGGYDTVLGLQPARQLTQLLTGAGWKGKLQEFGGGHEIPAEVLIQLGAYLRRVLA